ncbi:solute carrier family 2, facilitated glucose transporter member 5-like isoform X2 [Podarcis raffonei]|uniref:solute carrier family 2, facilitated glucose transporter member 5-like isoform X2 n=1 Tax=Podarcis raffonei TaxID=65483 RepID=UPI0023297316|nr:solute carrier family 2, facilitated glucose transporter member 5-like isoform X2 [Podarcis raffonei]
MDQGDEKAGAEMEREVNSEGFVQSTFQEARDSQKNVGNAATKKGELSMVLILVTVASCLIPMQHGYNLWVLYNTVGLLPSFYNITRPEEADFQITLLSITVTMFPLGASFATVPAGWLLDRFGRKVALFITNLSAIIFAVVMTFSLSVHNHGYIIFSRLCSGISTGICFCVGPLYLGEISPRSLRGGIIMMYQLFYLFGFLVAQILCLQEVLGTGKGFPILIKLFGVMPFLQLPLLPFLPESPRYLLIQKRDEESSRKALKKLRNRNDVEDEIEELHQEDVAEKSEKNMKPLKLLYAKKLRRQVIAIIVLKVGQQFDGISVAYSYAERNLRNINMGIYSSRFATIASTTFLCMSMVFGSVISDMGYFSIILICIFLFAHGIGPGPLPSVLVVELFLQSSRSSAIVIAQFLHWVLSFLVGLIFLYIEIHIGPYSLIFFCPFGFAIFVYIFKFIPETRNRTFVEIRGKVNTRNPRRVHFKMPSPK